MFVFMKLGCLTSQFHTAFTVVYKLFCVFYYHSYDEISLVLHRLIDRNCYCCFDVWFPVVWCIVLVSFETPYRDRTTKTFFLKLSMLWLFFFLSRVNVMVGFFLNLSMLCQYQVVKATINSNFTEVFGNGIRNKASWLACWRLATMTIRHRFFNYMCSSFFLYRLSY